MEQTIHTDHKNALITGGAGFIGCNLAQRLLQRGQNVIIYDNLSQWGAETNLAWLGKKYGRLLCFVKGDLRDYPKLVEVASNAEIISKTQICFIKKSSIIILR